MFLNLKIMTGNDENTKTLDLEAVTELQRLFNTHSIDETRITLSKMFFHTRNTVGLDTEYEQQLALQSYVKLNQLLTIIETCEMPYNINALTLEIKV